MCRNVSVPCVMPPSVCQSLISGPLPVAKQCDSVPATSASDTSSFRQFRQLLASPERNGISYNKIFRFYRQYFGLIGNIVGRQATNSPTAATLSLWKCLK